MGCVNRSHFLMPLRMKQEQYPLPEYGEGAYVVIRAMSAQDLTELQAKHAGESGLDFAYDVFARSLFDDEGNRLFESAEDAKGGMFLSLPAMEAMVAKCLEVSGVKSEKN